MDCVGLVCAAFGIPAGSVPGNYRLRGGLIERLKRELARFFRPVRTAASGDVLVLQVATDQLHLCIMTDRGFIHVDTRLRRVVETPGAPQWRLLSAHRSKKF